MRRSGAALSFSLAAHALLILSLSSMRPETPEITPFREIVRLSLVDTGPPTQTSIPEVAESVSPPAQTEPPKPVVNAPQSKPQPAKTTPAPPQTKPVKQTPKPAEPPPKPQERASAPPTETEPQSGAATSAGPPSTEPHAPSAAGASEPAIRRNSGRAGTPVVDVTSLTVTRKVTADYPMISRKRKDQGTVVLLALLQNGTVASVEIEKSSGHAPLDESAKKALLGWRFDMGEHGSDVKVRVPFTFTLK